MLKQVLLISLSLFSASFLSFAAENLPIRMAHEVGFFGCDSLIEEEFKVFNASSSNRINISYDRRFKDKFIGFLATYGSIGDGVLQSVTIVNHGKECQSFTFTEIITTKSCMQYREENPYWGDSATQGDYFWTQNNGGVIAIFKTAPVGGCIVSFTNNRTTNH